MRVFPIRYRQVSGIYPLSFLMFFQIRIPPWVVGKRILSVSFEWMRYAGEGGSATDDWTRPFQIFGTYSTSRPFCPFMSRWVFLGFWPAHHSSAAHPFQIRPWTDSVRYTEGWLARWSLRMFCGRVQPMCEVFYAFYRRVVMSRSLRFLFLSWKQRRTPPRLLGVLHSNSFFSKYLELIEYIDMDICVKKSCWTYSLCTSSFVATPFWFVKISFLFDSTREDSFVQMLQSGKGLWQAKRW